MANPILKLSVLLLVLILSQACSTSKKRKTMTKEEKLETMRVMEKPATLKSETKKLDSKALANYNFSVQLLGTWNWYRTDCCARMPNTTYAKDVEDSKKLVFSENKRMMYYKNNTVTENLEYEVGNAFNDDRITLRTGEFKTAIAHIKGDTLVLDYGYMDLAIDYYLKAK